MLNRFFSQKIIWVLCAIGIVGLDQWTKQLAVLHLNWFQSITVFPAFDLTLIYNTGAAFSFLDAASGWQTIFLSTVAIFMIIVLLIWLMRAPSHQYGLLMGLSFVLGGAIGNLIDRVRLGYVIDFIDLYVQRWHWPVFNVADTAVSVGIGLILISILMRNHSSSSTCNGR